jgi:dipeptidyl aminopeptidase/acylaminoacyl peptidase
VVQVLERTNLRVSVIASLVGSLLVVGSAHAAFPGTNGRIAFVSQGEIVTVAPDGSAQTNLTRHPAADSQPAWSPDGNRIAFTSTRDGNEEIYVMHADGSGQIRLTSNSWGDSSPAWSPNGRQIAFVGVPDIDYEVYAMSADGSGQRNLTRSPALEDEPAWSPDGRRIAFISDRYDRDADYDIFTMKPDGSAQNRLRSGSEASGSAPDWSPDGRRLVFEESDEAFGSASQTFVMNADGSGTRNLTRNSVGQDGQPAWSPDGRRVAFQRLTGEEAFQIYTMDRDGSHQKVLMASSEDQDAPDWQPIPNKASAEGVDGAPVLSSVRLRPKRFAPQRTRRRRAVRTAKARRPRSTTFRFTVSERARIAFKFERRSKGRKIGNRCRTKTTRNRTRRPCYRYVRLPGFRRSAHSGRNRTRFRGRLRGKALRPGRYRATLRATDSTGNRSRPSHLSFTILRR